MLSLDFFGSVEAFDSMLSLFLLKRGLQIPVNFEPRRLQVAGSIPLWRPWA